MGHGCEGSFYVAGLKVRSGTVTASWTKDGVTRTARVFTDGAQAKAHAARTGEDVITQKGLAQLSGKIPITARLDGLDGELPFDPRASSRTARRSFDPELLRETLSPEAYRQALDLATLELPENPGESRAYSEKLATAWFQAASPIGIVHRLTERPGVLGLHTVKELTELLGNSGVVTAMTCERVRHELSRPTPALPQLAATLEDQRLTMEGIARYHETRRLVMEAAVDRLEADPVGALEALLTLADEAGMACALHTVQAGLEAALLEDPDPNAPALLAAQARLRAVCEATEAANLAGPWGYADPSEWIEFLTDRAHAAVGLPLPTGVLRTPADAGPPQARLRTELDRVVRAPGVLPSPPQAVDVLAERHPEPQVEAEARWAMVCQALDAQYDVAVSTSMVQLDGRQERDTFEMLWTDADGGLALDPTAPGVSPVIQRAHWVGVDRDGRVLSYTHHDEWSTPPELTDRRTPDGASPPSPEPTTFFELLRQAERREDSADTPRCTRVEAAPLELERVVVHADAAAALAATPDAPSSIVISSEHGIGWTRSLTSEQQRMGVRRVSLPQPPPGQFVPNATFATPPRRQSARSIERLLESFFLGETSDTAHQLGALLATLELPDAGLS